MVTTECPDRATRLSGSLHRALWKVRGKPTEATLFLCETVNQLDRSLDSKKLQNFLRFKKFQKFSKILRIFQKFSKHFENFLLRFRDHTISYWGLELPTEI